MHEQKQNPNTPLCPGCHFRCQLDDPECGRGFRFQRQWEEEGTVPERRRPGQGGPKKGRTGHPNSFGDPRERLPFLLSRTVDLFTSKREGDGVLKAIQMHEGYASLHVIAERSRKGQQEAMQILEHLEWYGLVEIDRSHPLQPFAGLTDAGVAEVLRFAEERTEQSQRAFADFSEEELEQLETLLKKIMESARH